jgi:hypothetical protein
MAKQASTMSLRLRAEARFKPWDAIDIFDLAHGAGVELRFANIPSMEGMYLRQQSPLILIASERPSGRQRFTCAHELGHHLFEDSSRIDELLETTNPDERKSDEEIRADMFAGLLLMPKTTVMRGFAVRNLPIATASAIDVFRVSCWLGVGYSTLLNHLKFALHIIQDDHFASLIRHPPKSIRREILGRDIPEDLIVVDEFWDGRPIDARVGDLLLLPHGSTLEGQNCLAESGSTNPTLFRAVKPGIGRFESSSGWAAFARVMRKNYEGRAIFRHLEEVD